MNRPPERLANRPPSGNPTEDLATELFRKLQVPPRLEAARRARLDRAIARMAAGVPRRRWTAIAVPALALAVLVVVLPVARRHRHEEIRARGPEHRAAVTSPTSPVLLMFRINGEGQSEPLGDTIRRDDELAFAYRSDGSEQRLMVFARDEAGRIYWYHPAWTDSAQNPEAIPLAREPGVHELPAAVAHLFEGREVSICGLFTAETWRVREAEQELARGTLRPDCRKVLVTP